MPDDKVNILCPLLRCCICGVEKPTTRQNFGTKSNGLPRAQCRECRRALTNEYAALNRERGRNRARDRKELLESVGYVNQHLEHRDFLLSRQKRKCYFCKNLLDETTCEIDHLTPISRGGDNSLENLACCCRACNRAKGAQTEKEFKLWMKDRLKNYK